MGFEDPLDGGLDPLLRFTRAPVDAPADGWP